MHYDLIIVGGGMVGRSLACALRDSQLRIAVIDATAAHQPDPRLIALNYGSFHFLQRLGLGTALETCGAPIHEVHVSHRGHFGVTRLRSQDLPLEALGYVVRAQDLNQTLGQTLENQPDYFTEWRSARVKNIEQEETQVRLTVEEGGNSRQVTTQLVLAADGSHSTIRKHFNFETETRDYQQSALVTTTTLRRSHENRAYERFLDDGALAMLPLKASEPNQHQCATIWTASQTRIKDLLALPETAFLQELQTQFGSRLGRLEKISTRHSFPLEFIRVKNPIQGQVMLIGNAAHTLHPIAAQGLNLALYEIAHLSQAILKNAEAKRPLHTELSTVLAEIQPKLNLLLSHYLNHIFSSDFWATRFARQFGMIGLDLCPLLKRKFSRLLAMEKIKWMNA